MNRLNALLRANGVLWRMAVLCAALACLVSCSEGDRPTAAPAVATDTALPTSGVAMNTASAMSSAPVSTAPAPPTPISPPPTAAAVGDDPAVLVENRFLSDLRETATYQMPDGWEMKINNAPLILPTYDLPAVPLPKKLETVISEPAPRKTPLPPAPACCPQPGNPSIPLSPDTDDIRQFLNDGGSVANLEKVLNWHKSIQHGYASGSQSSLVLHQDLTGDSVPDVLIMSKSSFRYYPPHTSLTFFSCSDGRYEGGSLLSIEGDIDCCSDQGPWSMQDMNGNGLPEIILSYLESNTGLHIQILEWDGHQMISLIENPGNAIHLAPGDGQLGGDGRLADVDGNGTLELLVLQYLSCSQLPNRQDRLDVIGWDGRRFRRAYSEEMAVSACPTADYPGWTSYTTYDGALGDNDVPAVAIAPDGAVWAGTRRSGASRFDGETWTAFTPDNSPLGLSVVAIAVAPDGALWFGSWGAGVSRWDGKAWTTYTHEDGLVDDLVSSLAVAGDGTVWAGTEHGLTSFDGQTWTTVAQDVLAGSWIADIGVEPGGGVWVSAVSQGIFHLDDGAWTRFATKGGLGDSPARVVAVAPDGAVWFAGRDAVGRWDGQHWTRYGPGDGVPQEIYALVIDGNGVPWLGIANGIARLDGDTWSTYPIAAKEAYLDVWAIALAPDGTIWAGTDGTDGGLFRYQP